MNDNPYQSPDTVNHAQGTHEPGKKLGVFLIAPVISLLGSAVLIVAVMHVRSDRSQSRRPIVTFEGPLSGWMPELIHIGLGLSLLGLVAGVILLVRNHNDSSFSFAETASVSAMMVAVLNAMGSFVVYCAIMED